MGAWLLQVSLPFLRFVLSHAFHFFYISHFLYKSSATDVSAQATMKGVAKCDKHFELQSSVSQQNLERTLRSQEIPESTPASVPTAFATSRRFHHLWFPRWLCVIARQSASPVCLCREQCIFLGVAMLLWRVAW